MKIDLNKYTDNESYKEVLNTWLELFENSNSTIDLEIEDTKGTISNENLWVKGAADKEEENMHLENICILEIYLNILNDIKKENI